MQGITIRRGWRPISETVKSKINFSGLRDDYIPGDLGFDPLNLATDENFREKRTKELQVINETYFFICINKNCV